MPPDWKIAQFGNMLLTMDNVTDSVPPGWREILSESEAELAAGHVVPSEVVHRELQASLARLETKATAKTRKAISRR